MNNKRRVAYMYDNDVGKYHYGCGHPMKPYRINITNSLVIDYGLDEYMTLYRPYEATMHDINKLHSIDYIKFVQLPVGPTHRLPTFSAGNDCPIFDGLYEFCSKYTGASLNCAYLINNSLCDIGINWSGGLHHARRSSASGFCYINDIVLSILELLRRHSRVLYVDIDCHHGDGVQESFYHTNRVCTLSFHRYGKQFFPGTGHMYECGGNDESYGTSINVPLPENIPPAQYLNIFQKIVKDVIYFYQPNCIVMQCGADSLAGDRLGGLNLQIEDHGKCVSIIRSYNLPTIILGGGGYTVRHVSRCWAYETAICVDETLPDHLPDSNIFYDYFGEEKLLTPKLVTGNDMNLISMDKLQHYLHTLHQHVYGIIKKSSQSISMKSIPESIIDVDVNVKQVLNKIVDDISYGRINDDDDDDDDDDGKNRLKRKFS
ncbi:hypothetical protein SNEBB_003725 [Seison nebaliae]|nr:hypothetical protein SNEBB_003725 [Seison nebaliae]